MLRGGRGRLRRSSIKCNPQGVAGVRPGPARGSRRRDAVLTEAQRLQAAETLSRMLALAEAGDLVVEGGRGTALLRRLEGVLLGLRAEAGHEGADTE